MSIAILIPMCSRNQTWTTLEECYFLRSFLPRFEASKTAAYTYRFYLGIDDDDAFFLAHRRELEQKGFGVYVLSGCQHAPAQAWNRLFEAAVADGHEYFFQIGDDVILQSRKWTERFIEVLQLHGNKGVVGPCHPQNYWMRKNAGTDPVIENAFVHRSHYDIFGYLFPPDIRNWYCDNWMTQVYAPFCAYTCQDIIVQNQCIGNRYAIEQLDISALVEAGRTRLLGALKGCFSFCLFGTQEKYRKGMARNVEMIQAHYPHWDIRIYASPDCEEFARSLSVSGVTTIATHADGFVNVLYRFHALFETYDVVCVRDADSRIHDRDRWCIEHFLRSPFTAYTIRDHPFHTYPIMGGLWGIKRGHPLFSPRDLEQFAQTSHTGYTTDTTFLEKTLSRKNLVVYSYDPKGVRNDESETVCVIGEPIRDQNFCGNVMLFGSEGEFPEFTHPESVEANE